MSKSDEKVLATKETTEWYNRFKFVVTLVEFILVVEFAWWVRQ